MTKKELEAVLAKYAKGTDAKLEIIIDDVRGLKTDVAELKENVAELKGTVNNMFDQVGKLSVDMEIVKDTVQRHEQKISQR